METRKDTSQHSLSDHQLSDYLISSSAIKLNQDRRLGSGGFGTVFQGEYQEADVAIKVLNKGDEKSIDSFKREMRVMCRLYHPNTVKIFGVCLEEHSYMIIMEYMAGGDLYHFLQSDQEISWKTRYQIALDVSAGLSYLHGKSILHCDLKSQNVLLGHDLRAKLTDFGLSKMKSENSDYGSCPPATWAYMAPELIDPELIGEKESQNSRAADVYAYGVVLWELGTRKKPFDGLNPAAIVRKTCAGQREPISADTPPAMAALILDCWKEGPQARPTMPAAIKFLKERSIIPVEGLAKITLKEPTLAKKKPQSPPINQAPKNYSSGTLLKAAEKGDLEAVKWLLANGSSIGEKDVIGTALLHAAYGGDCLEVVRWLLSNGSSMGEKGYEDRTALLYAAERGHLEVMRWLLSNGSSVDEKTSGGRTALLLAAKEGRLEIVRWLLSNGSSVGEKDNKGMTALLCAAERGHLEIVRLLLASGASIGEKDDSGWTALVCAVSFNRLEVVRLLLASGASIGEKELHEAVNPEMKEFLRIYRSHQHSSNPSVLFVNQSPKPAPQQKQETKTGFFKFW